MNKDFVKDVLDSVKGEEIRAFLQELAKEPHIAASERDRFLKRWIKEKWEGFGFDSVSLSTYDFLFSYPNREEPNKIFLLDEQNNIRFTSKHEEDVLRPEDYNEKFIHAFNGYTPA